METLLAAQIYLARGYQPIPIPRGSKAPCLAGWPKFRTTSEELQRYFDTKELNIGLLLGAPSSGLVDIDLDVPEAIHAANLLPATGMIHGRPSAARSHWWYLVDPVPRSKRYVDVDGTCLAELRATGYQTLVPPSLHPSGEQLEWSSRSKPAYVDPETLIDAVKKVAAVALLARHWPGTGSRQTFTLSLSGALLTAGWSAPATIEIITAAADAAGDEEATKRSAVVGDTATRIKNGRPIAGYKQLTDLLDGKVIANLEEWLGLKAEPHSTKRTGHSTTTKASEIVQLAAEADLFHSDDGVAFASIAVESHLETWPIRSKAIELWLKEKYFRKNESIPTNQNVSEAIDFLEARALFEAQTLPTFIRLGDHEGQIYLDLCNETWGTVRICQEGWDVTQNCPIKFRRTRGMRPLPKPTHGGSLGSLREFLNIDSESDWHLILAWLLGALRPTGPCPVLIFQGEAGSAKSTAASVIRGLIDPATPMLRSMPRNERDFVIGARNNWILPFDNLSGISNNASDMVCRMSTGTGYATRALYSNDEEIVFSAQRPIILTSIDDIATRQDLIDRSIVISLPPIPEYLRRDEQTFWQEYEARKPEVLGALLDVVAAALMNLPHVDLAEAPRMADFTKWGCAAESPLGIPKGGFKTAFESNRESAIDVGLEADPIGDGVRRLLKIEHPWRGTATQLLALLETVFDPHVVKSRYWPKNASALGNRLRRIAPALRSTGIDVEFRLEGHNRQRVITLKYVSTAGVRGVRAARRQPNTRRNPPKIRPATARSTAAGTADDADGADSKKPPLWRRVLRALPRRNWKKHANTS